MEKTGFSPPVTLQNVPSNRDGTALIVPGKCNVSYEEIISLIQRTARILRRLFVSPKETSAVIAIAQINCVECVVSFLGTAWAGASSAPLNPDYTMEEFKFYLEDNCVDALLVTFEGNELAEAAAASLGIPIVCMRVNGPTDIELRLGRSSEVMGEEEVELPIFHPKETAMYMHTSGTTSRPKRVQITHENICGSLHNIQRTYELTDSDSTLLVMPLFHVHGLIAALLTSLATGGTIIIMGKFSATKFWEQAITYKATWYTAVPSIHQVLLMRASTDYPSESHHLRFIRSCSSSLAPPILHQLEDTFGVPVLEAYAMTENAHQMTSNPLPKFGDHKPGSVGKPTFIDLAILDDDCMKVPTGTTGEVCIRGKTVTPGYVNNPQANVDGFKGGWFHTGDQGFVDSEGYLFLTGRLKEMINRGGEKISPLEVDSVLLAFPKVAAAVSFAAPHDKYGEEVNAAIVLKAGLSATADEIQAHCKAHLALFKIPKQIFFVEDIPKTATGKVQRRNVAEYILSKTPPPAVASQIDGYELVAKALYDAGIRFMFGVVGIPVTRLSATAQQVGIRFISFRNEQAAGYAASAIGYLTGSPAVLLTVSGPGCVHGLAGLSNATVNAWPMIMVSGSTSSENVGMGGFQELDQMQAAASFAKKCLQAKSLSSIADVVCEAVIASLSGKPGGSYVDLPSDVLHSKMSSADVGGLLDVNAKLLNAASADTTMYTLSDIQTALEWLTASKNPLVVFGKGAAYAKAEKEIEAFVNSTGIPFLPSPMGKGIIPDSHPLNVSAARSFAIGKADVVLLIGARLNWIFHFGKPPQWQSDVKFIIVDIDESLREQAPVSSRVFLVGDACQVMQALRKSWAELDPAPFQVSADGEWVQSLQATVGKNKSKMASKLVKDVYPLNYHAAYTVIIEHLSKQEKHPFIVSEGANTMDIGRSLVPIEEPRKRLDAGTWGTMGVGLGYMIAAALTDSQRLVVGLEGDSGFGFSAMEVETIVRYALPIVIIVFNNNGIYGGNQKSEPSCAFPSDPSPTCFVPTARYDQMMAAFGGDGYFAQTYEELDSSLSLAFSKAILEKKPAVINVAIDPFCGVESGRMQSHN